MKNVLLKQYFDDHSQVLRGLRYAGVVVLVLAVIKGVQIAMAISAASSRVPPPEAVTSAKAVEEEWPSTISAVGSVTPVQGATLGAEVAGRVSKILYRSGDEVKEGQVLVELDAAVEQADLEGALAQLQLATITVNRERTLRQRQANSQAELETAEATFRARSADVGRLKAQIAKKRIIAPFDGRAGIVLVNVGETVPEGTEIVSVQSLRPVYVDFSVTQQYAKDLTSGSEVQVTADAYPGQEFSGVLSAVEPEVRSESRTIALRATMPNEKEELRAGMFVKVTLILSRSDRVIQIPGSSVLYAPYGNTIYIVEKMKTPEGAEYLGARPQVVTLGRRRGDQVAVLTGLKPGEEVATSGAFKLRPGAAVFVDNSIAPDNNPNPHPPDT